MATAQVAGDSVRPPVIRSIELNRQEIFDSAEAKAMIAKGWLEAGTLPEAATLDVALTGPAREVLFPASADSFAAGLRGALRR